MIRRVPRAAALALILSTVPLAACEHPLGVVTPHVEAADLLVADPGGTLLARTLFNRTWSVEQLRMQDGTPLQLVLTPLDFRGDPIDLSSRSDLSYRMEARDGSMVQWEPQRGFGWLRPFSTGTTEIRFLIWHSDHADFVSPWLTLEVTP